MVNPDAAGDCAGFLASQMYPETAPSSTRWLSEKSRLELAARSDSASDVNSTLPIHHNRQLEVMLHVHRGRGKRRSDRREAGTEAPVGLPDCEQPGASEANTRKKYSDIGTKVHLLQNPRPISQNLSPCATEDSVRSENTGVPVIREIMVATTMSSFFVALFALVASSSEPVLPCRRRSSCLATNLRFAKRTCRVACASTAATGPCGLLVLIVVRLAAMSRIVQPDTVLFWHRRAFAWHWTRKSRECWPQFLGLPRRRRNLIQRMSQVNPLYGEHPAFTENCSNWGLRRRNPR
jgi:hypothetical protein